jgi:CheY-like chemotaxis protein
MQPAPPPAVLVVEDDPSIRAVIAEALRDDGYRVLEAPDGHAAIRAV